MCLDDDWLPTALYPDDAPADEFTEGEEGAKSLRAALAAKLVDAVTADAAFKRVAASCTSCQKAHRD